MVRRRPRRADSDEPTAPASPPSQPARRRLRRPSVTPAAEGPSLPEQLPALPDEETLESRLTVPSTKGKIKSSGTDLADLRRLARYANSYDEPLVTLARSIERYAAQFYARQGWLGHPASTNHEAGKAVNRGRRILPTLERDLRLTLLFNDQGEDSTAAAQAQNASDPSDDAEDASASDVSTDSEETGTESDREAVVTSDDPRSVPIVRRKRRRSSEMPNMAQRLDGSAMLAICTYVEELTEMLLGDEGMQRQAVRPIKRARGSRDKSRRLSLH